MLESGDEDFNCDKYVIKSSGGEWTIHKETEF